ncbi:cytochrome P450 [Backusella circina FSU 941]|nr:cytochrome P450 [Backusella circina FSU 941]
MSLISRESVLKRQQRFGLPIIYSKESNGLYVRPERFGWEIQVTNPVAVKRVFLKQVHLFGKLAQELFEEMDKMEPRVEITDLMARWTLDAIGKAGFETMNGYADITLSWGGGIIDPFFFMFPMLESHFLWLFPKRRRLHRELDQFLDMMRNIIEAKRQKIENDLTQNDTWSENEKDLLTLMLESEYKGEGKMTNEELETNTLSFAIYYLAKYPKIQQRAREEAKSILGDRPENTLRINGPSSNVVTRVASEDCELPGTFIPKGAHLTVNVFDTHHSEKNWSDPLRFDPDRFSPNGEGSRTSGQGMHWVPFGNGTRQCIGMNFSLNEQRLMLAMLLRKYTWTLPEDSVHMDDVITTGIMVIGPTPMDIVFTKNF